MASGLLKNTQNRSSNCEIADKMNENSSNNNDSTNKITRSSNNNDSTNKITRNQFLNAMKLLVEKPHVINRKVCGFERFWIGCTKTSLEMVKIFTEVGQILHDVRISQLNSIKLAALIQVLSKIGFEEVNCVSNSNSIPWSQISNLSQFKMLAIVRNILPKNIGNQKEILEIVIIDQVKSTILFVAELPSENSPKVLPELTYSLSLVEETIELKIWTEMLPNDSSFKWLNEHLLPCVTKWAYQMKEDDEIQISSSMHLVNIQKYNRVYQDLKSKYGQPLIQMWTENTDPLKFVFEDIAIASYLIVLWEQEREKKHLVEKQSFLDLGCGNGLLVYLLSSEGYPGKGIDIKRRKIWDQFPKYVDLKEEIIEPSNKCLYPNHDWLIGNHSDELTPWLPVIAAKSEMKTRFFVIPCCAHDFHSKFQRRKGGMSQYAEYCEYIEHIGRICGFEMLRDKLRIPSTKRTCLIGQNRNYDMPEWKNIIDGINNLIQSKCTPCLSFHNEKSLQEADKQNNCVDSNALWCNEFKSREAIQKVRNCTQIKTQVKEILINRIASILLAKDNFIKVKRKDEIMEWNTGGKISMKNLVNELDEDLKSLKSECGGLQTLLRNHKFIFKLENSEILLRVPESVQQRRISSERLRTKKCWFYQNHPQGCVLSNDDCTYIH